MDQIDGIEEGVGRNPRVKVQTMQTFGVGTKKYHLFGELGMVLDGRARAYAEESSPLEKEAGTDL